MNNQSRQKSFLSLEVEQKQQISLAMRHSLDILQMPIDELSCWLEKQIEENPFLDWKEVSYQKKLPDLNIEIAYEPSLFEYLMIQARENIQDPDSLQKMEWIIGNLEDSGFFTLPLDVAPFSWSRKELESLLKQLQTFDPPGIGAKDLQESLLLQLKIAGKEKQLSYLLIEKHLEDLLQGKFAYLSKKYETTDLAIHEAIHHDIAILDPFPGLRFQKKPTTYLTPDVFFIEEDNSWKIEINDEKLPSYSFSSYSVDLESFENPEDKFFCKRYLNQAKWIDSMIEKRKQTLYKVTHFLVEKQIAYLKEESNCLIPLNMKQLAQELDLHESTITRALYQKNISCRWGTFPLKNLLSHHLNKMAENISSDQAQKLLQKLIAEENKSKPLSDREILEKMTQIGIPCARRTITKYRKVLNIPSKRFRRRSSNKTYSSS